MSRQGKHRDDKYRVQAYYEAHEKAIFVLVAKLYNNMTLTDLIRAAIYDRARSLGILDADNKVTERFMDALKLEMSIIQQAEHNKKGSQK